MGTIKILSEGLPGDCSLLKPFSVSFQEYYLGGTFYTAANWRGPYLNQDGCNASSGLAAYDALSDCGNASYPSNVSSAVPLGPSGRPNAFFSTRWGNTAWLSKVYVATFTESEYW